MTENFKFQLLLLTICYSLFTFFLGCGKKELSQKTTEISQKPTVPVPITGLIEKKLVTKYRYKGEIYRDPFIPPDEKKIVSPILEASGEGLKPALGSLTLKGIIIDSKQKIALFSSPTGRYILRNGKLYDNRNRIVRGLTGTVLDNNTIKLITEDKFVKTYKLKEEKY
ncbi:MAG: hypothetical protein ACK4JE_02845 [Endomicrobiia bacterium]